MKITIIFTMLLLPKIIFCQNSGNETFERIKTELENFNVDTSAAPPDKLTQEIIKLREVKGGFNINEAVLFKITEERAEGKISGQQADQFELFFSEGNGKKWLDNAMIHIYRDHFNVAEIKKICRFYNSSAGKKFAGNFPVVIIKATKAAEMIMDQIKDKK